MSGARAMAAAAVALGAGCDAVVVQTQGPTRVEYTGSVLAYALAAGAALAVAGAIGHLARRLRRPARGYALTIGIVALGILAAVVLARPIVTGILVDGGAGTLTVRSRALAHAFSEEVAIVSTQEVRGIEVARWPAFIPGSPLYRVTVLFAGGGRLDVDTGFDCLDLRLLIGEVGRLTGRPPVRWRSTDLVRE